MSYNDRVEELATAIASAVQFDNVTQAREFAAWYRLPQGAHVRRQLEAMAENFMVYASRFEIASLLNKINRDARLSALREAIWLCAKRTVERYELEELASLGSFDRQATTSTVI